jgi:TonB family protein
MTKLYFPAFALFMLLLLFGSSSAQDNSSTNSNQQSDETIYKQSEVDQKAKIINKPIPSTDRMCDNDNGLVRVRVVLLKSGKVGDVESVKSSECEHFNENSLDSARKIKFSPALKDGQPVSVSVMIEYKYSIHTKIWHRFTK